jgi:hypothetical protein
MPLISQLRNDKVLGKIKAQEALKILQKRFPDSKFEIVEAANKMKMLVRDRTFLAWIIKDEIDLENIHMKKKKDK